MMRSFVLLATLLVSSQAGTTSYSYDKSDDAANQLELHDSNVEISKEIFSFSPPPEQTEDDVTYPLDLPTNARKHIKVIFIRSPEYPSLTNALANLIRTNTEQKTVIYILNKQSDLSELSHKLHESKQGNPNKPEVRFVKYRTPEDAETAVRDIQNQYLSLAGATQSHGNEIAPVVEFTSGRSR